MHHGRATNKKKISEISDTEAGAAGPGERRMDPCMEYVLNV